MTQDLHGFITGQLWLKLKADVVEFRVFSQADFVHAAYFHVRRFLLIQPGWMCRAGISTPAGKADLVLYRHDRFQSVLQFENLLKPDVDNYFPADMLDQKMERLRQALRSFEKAGLGRGYLFGAFDTTESWFFPSGGDAEERASAPGFEQAMWEKQSCFWVPVNCREFPNHAEWRAKWERLTNT